MNLALHRVRDWLRATSWLVPSVMAAAALALAAGTLHLDRAGGDEARAWAAAASSPEAARLVLIAIAGTTLLVAGIVFSVLVVALVLASRQFGPRALRLLPGDIGNQVALGTFTAAFVFALAVLSAIDGSFSANVSLTAALALAVACMGMLVYTIRHVATQIEAPNVVLEAARELDLAVEAMFPPSGRPAAPAGNHHEEDAEEAAEMLRCGSDVVVLRARRAGYVQRVARPALLALAGEQDVLIQLERRPGQYVSKGEPLARIWPGSQLATGGGPRVLEAIVVGSWRSLRQDVEFAADQLVEIAVRALSPAINDPFTAMACVDRLGDALGEIIRRPVPDRRLRDAAGRVRVLLYPVSPGALIDAAFNQVRQSARHSAAVSIRLLEVITKLAEHADRDEDRSALLRHALAIHGQASKTVPDQQDRQDLSDRYRAAVSALGRNANAGPWH